MTPFRRGKGGRRAAPRDANKAPEERSAEGRSGRSEEASSQPRPSARERSKLQAETEREAAKQARDRAGSKRGRKPREPDREPPKSKHKAADGRRRPRDEPGRSRSAKPDGPKSPRRREKAPAARRRSDRRPLPERVRSAARAAWSSPRATKARSGAEKGLQLVLAWLLAGLKSLLAGLKVVGALVLGGLQELGRFWIRTAEILGGAILWVERTVRPLVLAALRLTRRGLAWAAGVVTPTRAVAAVVISAAVVLAVSQFVDYRGVKIGAPAYAGVEPVAPAPQTDRQTTGSVHGYAMVPVALVVIGAVILTLRGRWRVARVIPLLGALVIAVSLLLDARKGLEEGDAGIAYEGAIAVLIEGFWLQVVSAAVLVVTGLLLSRYARDQKAPAPRRRRASERGDGRRRRFRITGVRA